MKALKIGGDYPLVGAFFYGTVAGASPSTQIHPEYGEQPIGQLLGKSGRVQFSDQAVITVKEADPQPVADIHP